MTNKTTMTQEERKAEESALWQYWIVARHDIVQFNEEIYALNRGTERTPRDGSHPDVWTLDSERSLTDPRD